MKNSSAIKILYLILIFSTVSLNAQNNIDFEGKSDSLYKSLIERIDLEVSYDYSMIKDSLINSDRAYGLALTGKNNEAFSYIEKELKVNPINIDAINAYGINLINIGRPQLAIKFFDLVLKMISDDRTARFNLAYAYEKSDMHSSAIKEYSTLITRYPDASINYICRARIYHTADSVKNSIQDYEHALLLGINNDTDMDSLAIYLKLGYLYQYRQADIVKAIEYYTYALNLDNNNIEVLARRGDAYFSINSFDKALIDFNTVIDLKGTKLNSKFFEMRAYIYIINRELDLAIKDLDVAIMKNPDKYSTYNQRGTVYFELNQKDKACEDFNKAIELGYNRNDKVDK